MKSAIKTIIIFLAFLSSISPAKSQDAFGTLLFEGGFPVGDFRKTHIMLWGAGFGYEHPLGDVLALGGNLGFDFLFGKQGVDDATGFTFEYANSFMIPLQAFVKYYPQDQQDGFYLQMNGGIHYYKAMEVTYDSWGTPQYSENIVGGFSFAPAIGLMVDPVDISLRYQVVSTSPPANYIAIKTAYNIF